MLGENRDRAIPELSVQDLRKVKQWCYAPDSRPPSHKQHPILVPIPTLVRARIFFRSEKQGLWKAPFSPNLTDDSCGRPFTNPILIQFSSVI